jgi:hypothetical protein
MMPSTAPSQPGVYEYAATFTAWSMLFCPPKLGASASMMKPRMKMLTTAMTIW